MKLRLMIVDDSSVFRNRIVRLVTSDQMSNITVVALASDGLDAVRLAKEMKPDLVTMDLTMPRLEGAEALEQLATVLPNARVLVVSALSDRTTALKALSKGAHGFLLKPFSDQQLINSLKELIA